MTTYLAGRLASVLLSLIVASIAIFLIMEVLPGDPAQFILGMNAQPDTLAALRAQLGLDAPPLIRYFGWMLGMLHGDFGTSYTYRVPVAELIVQRIGVSLPLAGLSLALTLIIAFPAGILAAARRNSKTDFAGWDKGFGQGLRALILPSIALALPQASILARVMRSALLDTLEEDYIRTARARGLSRAATLWRHAVRNALIPVLTIVGLQFAFLLAGGIIIENVFFLPGLGRLVFQGITQRDLIVVKSVVMLLVFAVILVNFLVDLSYLAVDPRLRRRA